MTATDCVPWDASWTSERTQTWTVERGREERRNERNSGLSSLHLCSPTTINRDPGCTWCSTRVGPHIIFFIGGSRDGEKRVLLTRYTGDFIGPRMMQYTLSGWIFTDPINLQHGLFKDDIENLRWSKIDEREYMIFFSRITCIVSCRYHKWRRRKVSSYFRRRGRSISCGKTERRGQTTGFSDTERICFSVRVESGGTETEIERGWILNWLGRRS